MNFAITGVAGYIAPRHLKAIHATGNRLVAALDPHDSVGVLDSFFPQTAFFTEYERFDRHLEKLRHGVHESSVDYLSICSPNHLHDAHIRLALRIGADAICEKPLVLNPWNLDALQHLERETGRRVWTILQLRAHPALIALREKVRASSTTRRRVTLNYVTSRGIWYRYSWKGNTERSGGIVTNIGIHFFDLLLWLFGPVSVSQVDAMSETTASGTLELQNADVRWRLSIDAADLPPQLASEGHSTWRSIVIDGEEVEFTDGFTDLHTRVYERTIAGDGFGIEDARPAIELAHRIRTQ
ncbi:MAG: Gfo/Idh/MocA family oxidoreductase [Ignavibacteria bacterium]|nr:Gfo/Idh/MocA family oxidoreductase [Ignavibacteria bacterium]